MSRLNPNITQSQNAGIGRDPGGSLGLHYLMFSDLERTSPMQGTSLLHKASHFLVGQCLVFTVITVMRVMQWYAENICFCWIKIYIAHVTQVPVLPSASLLLHSYSYCWRQAPCSQLPKISFAHIILHLLPMLLRYIICHVILFHSQMCTIMQKKKKKMCLNLYEIRKSFLWTCFKNILLNLWFPLLFSPWFSNSLRKSKNKIILTPTKTLKNTPINQRRPTQSFFLCLTHVHFSLN